MWMSWVGILRIPALGGITDSNRAARTGLWFAETVYDDLNAVCVWCIFCRLVALSACFFSLLYFSPFFSLSNHLLLCFQPTFNICSCGSILRHVQMTVYNVCFLISPSTPTISLHHIDHFFLSVLTSPPLSLNGTCLFPHLSIFNKTARGSAWLFFPSHTHTLTHTLYLCTYKFTHIAQSS